ncbi:hypothetical protein I7I48_07821 [Histoplasma ohiense]|nr:hypothetical protein I7I48_07821 [Histoplasma ohiense (nom. inval.)]
MNQPFKRKQGDFQTLIITTKPNDNQKSEIQNRRPTRNLILSPPKVNSFYGYNTPFLPHDVDKVELISFFVVIWTFSGGPATFAYEWPRRNE